MYCTCPLFLLSGNLSAFFAYISSIHEGYTQPLPCPRNRHIGQLLYLFFSPPGFVKPVQADNKDAGIVEFLDAVDGGDCHALSRYVIRSFAAVICHGTTPISLSTPYRDLLHLSG